MLSQPAIASALPPAINSGDARDLRSGIASSGSAARRASHWGAPRMTSSLLPRDRGSHVANAVNVVGQVVLPGVGPAMQHRRCLCAKSCALDHELAAAG